MGKKRSKKQRLSSDERRLAILEAAVPLFAEEGFRGVTTRKLAERAGVSEALLYQHFPSKEALYTEMQDWFCERHSDLEDRFLEQEPTTATLVLSLFIFATFVLKPPRNLAVDVVFPRLMLQSLLADGTFARMHHERNTQPFVDFMARGLAAARAAGDATPASTAPDRLCIHFAMNALIMIHINTLPTPPVFELPTDVTALMDHAMRFMLHGVGLTDAAIARHYDFARLEAQVTEFLTTQPTPEKE